MFAPRLPCGDQCPLEGARIFSQYLESIHRLFSGSMLTYNNQASEDMFKSVQFPVQRQCLNTCLWKLLNIQYRPFQQGEVTFSIVFRKISLLPFIVTTLSLSGTNICARCPGFTREQTPPRLRTIQITLPSHCLVFAFVPLLCSDTVPACRKLPQ